jgi:hypothetical protein
VPSTDSIVGRVTCELTSTNLWKWKHVSHPGVSLEQCSLPLARSGSLTMLLVEKADNARLSEERRADRPGSKHFKLWTVLASETCHFQLVKGATCGGHIQT